MIIKIDNREDSELISKCEELTALDSNTIIQENLPLGDIIILDDNNEERVIIERKTVNDLAASIKDGRYAEQSFRLTNCSQENHNIIYLIEGKIDNFKHYKDQRIDKNILWSAIISLNHFKGFSVIRTDSLKETCEFIISLVKKIQKEKDKKPYYSNNQNKQLDNQVINVENNNDSDKKYADVVKRVKKDNIDSSNILQIMLSQIPNVSTASAKAICEVYPTMKDLVFDLNEEGISCLDKLKMKSGTMNEKGEQKSRKLSKTCKENIKNFILGITPEK